MDPKGFNFPGGCKSKEEFEEYISKKIKECIGENKSTHETENHLWEKFQIEPPYTRIIWDRLRKQNPEELKKTTGEQVTKLDSSIVLTKKTEMNLPGGCTSIEEFSDYLIKKVEDCFKENKSKTETETSLWDKFKIDPRFTKIYKNSNASSLFVTGLRKIHEQIELENKASEQQVDAAGLNLPGGCKSMEEFEEYLIKKVKECNEEKKSLRETMNHLSEKFQIDTKYTRSCLFHLASPDSDLCKSLITDLRKRYEEIETEKRTAEQVKASAQTTQVNVTTTAPSPSAPKREGQISSEESATKKRKTQLVQTSTKQPDSSSETESVEQMPKLLTDAAKSKEKQPVEQEQVRGDKEEETEEDKDTQELDTPRNEDTKDNTK